MIHAESKVVPEDPPHAGLTLEDARWRIERILSNFGVKIKLGGCGCCGSPYAELAFPDGKAADFDNFYLDNSDVPDQRG